MNGTDFKSQVIAAARKNGIDLIGFASKERFAGVDAQHNPFSIFPEAQTVIMIGRRICRGALRGVEEGTNFGDYALFGKNWLEDEFLSVSCYNLVNMLEDNGSKNAEAPLTVVNTRGFDLPETGDHGTMIFTVLGIAQLTHSHEDYAQVTIPTVAPTCTQTGLTEGKHCSVCNEAFYRLHFRKYCNYIRFLQQSHRLRFICCVNT